MRFKDKVVIVTGASRGIGKGIAAAFAREGAHVILAARHLNPGEAVRPGSLSEAEKEITALGAGGRVLTIKTDVGIQSDVEELISKTIKEFGWIDVLVNVAWPMTYKAELLDDMRPEETEAEINAFRGYVNTCRAVLPHMRRQQKGVIVNITSAGSKQKVALWPVYAGLKAAVAHFSRSLSLAVGAEGIRVNCVGPGMTNTESTQTILKDMIEYITSVETPLRRLGNVEEIANAVLFIASDEASYITGQDLSVDGGIGPY